MRLRSAYIIRCDEVVKDADGTITKLLCHVDRDTLNKNPEDRKVKGVIHWVSAAHAVSAPVRLFDRLFSEEKPDADKDRDFTDLSTRTRWRRRPPCTNRAWPICQPYKPASSSGLATSPDTGYRSRGRRSSTVRLACVTPGQKPITPIHPSPYVR